jgi:hypothetical protein
MATAADQRTIRVDHVGRERQPVVVVENFSPHPERLLAEAAGLAFEPMGAFYPGVRARVGPAYFDGLAEVLTPVMREVFGARDKLNVNRALYSLATTPPAELGLAQRIPHIDGVTPGMIAIIHYLTTDDLGGTAFWRHRSTGFETVDAARHDQYLTALADDFARHGEPEPAYIGADTPIFEHRGLRHRLQPRRDLPRQPAALRRPFARRAAQRRSRDRPADRRQLPDGALTRENAPERAPGRLVQSPASLS